MKKNNDAFTLAELLIVIAIVGILVAISIPYFSKKLEQARETADIHTMRAAAALGQQFYYEGVTNKESAINAGMAWYSENNNESSPGSNAFAIYIPEKGTFFTLTKEEQEQNKTLSPNMKKQPNYDKYIAAGYKAYGKGRNQDGGVDVFGDRDAGGRLLRVYDPTIDYRKGVCQVSIFPNGSNKRVEVAWKELKTGATRPFIGNNQNGKDGYRYSQNNFPRLVIYLN